LALAKVAKVVVAMVDPNPLVAGKGIEALKAAGIEIELGDGAAKSAALNQGFLSRMTRQKPWVR
jgi:diaminohydroxyphosphoribosylaminopyrimidine deaminase/5-amino-6-(5-phosphoribosylamino)uracil reductase